MTQQGAALQGYNNELVKCIEDLCMQKEQLNKQIQQAEEEKSRLQHEIQTLNEQLECVCENLAQKTLLLVWDNSEEMAIQGKDRLQMEVVIQGKDRLQMESCLLSQN